MFRSSAYTPDLYPFPNSNVDPRNKGLEYCRKWNQAIYSLWQSNGTAWGVDSMDYFDRMRKYADGNQDSDQYRSFVKNSTREDDTSVPTIYDDASWGKEAKRRGYDALVFQNLSPAAKILSSLHGLMDKLDYDIMADTVDSDSRGLLDFLKYKKYHEARDVKWQVNFKKKAGLPVDEPTNFPKSKEELDAYEAREGFKLNVAKSMQKLLRHSFNISGWDSVVRKKVIDDLICTQYGTTMDYFDIETQAFKTKWIDPKNTVIQYSNEFDYSDSEYGGYFDTMTISALRQAVPDLSHEEIVELAKKNKGRLGNPGTWNDRHSKLDEASNLYGCDDWKVCVFKAYWIDTDTHRNIRWKGKGSERVIDIGFDSKVKGLTEGQKARGFKQDVKNVPIRLVYQCSWIVESDICFDFGKYHMAARPKMTKPKLPIHAEQLLQPSIIYRLIPIFDHIAIAWLQFQNDLANMVQRGYAINMGMLLNVAMNGKDLDPSQVLMMWKQKGLLPYMPGPDGMYGGGMPTPITPIDGGLGDRVEQTALIFNFYYSQIEGIVGINPLALGATPDPNAPVSTSEAALKATSNVLKPILDAMFELKESLAESLCMRIQIGLRVSDKIRSAYAGIVNPNDIKAMMMAEKSGTQYGISLRARPDEKQRADIVNLMNLAVQKGTLPETEAMYFIERINSGEDIGQIRIEMAYSIDKFNERVQAEKLQAVKAQNDGLAQIEAMKAQNTAKQTVLETQGKITEENARNEGKMKVERQKNNYALLQETMQGMMAEQGLNNSTPK